jgi:hypothetical protein
MVKESRKNIVGLKNQMTGTLYDVYTFNESADPKEVLERLRKRMHDMRNPTGLEDSLSTLAKAFETGDFESLKTEPYKECYQRGDYMHLTKHGKVSHIFGMQDPIITYHPYIEFESNEWRSKNRNAKNAGRTFRFFLYLVFTLQIERLISFKHGFNNIEQNFYEDLLVALPGIPFEFAVIPVVDHSPPDMKTAIRILELGFLDQKRTTMHCTAGFGRTGLMMLLLAMYQDCLDTHGEFLRTFEPPHDEAGFARLRTYIDTFYANEFKGWGGTDDDSAALELTNFPSYEENTRVLTFVRRINTILYACAYFYLLTHGGDMTVRLYKPMPAAAPETKRSMRKWYFEDGGVESVRVVLTDSPTEPVYGGFSMPTQVKKSNTALPATFNSMSVSQLNKYLFGKKIPAGVTQDPDMLREIGREIYRTDTVYGINFKGFKFFNAVKSKHPKKRIKHKTKKLSLRKRMKYTVRMSGLKNYFPWRNHVN